MRTLFLASCVLVGILGGLWWSGITPDDLHLRPAADSKPDTSVIATVPEPLQPAIAATDNAPVAPDSTRAFSYNDGIMSAAPAVVSVYASDSTTGSENAATSQGSGVIVDADGIVLTNLHLIENFRTIEVVLNDGRRFKAEIIGSDAETDLAVVRIDATQLPFTKLDEAAPLKVGDIVLAIGNPFGVGQTVTQGIVSATRRRIANGTVWQDFIQIDAAINPGNSGGALINPLGQLVGVNTAVFRAESGNVSVGIGYAIPADLLAQVVPQIIENGSVSRGWLGLGVEDINMFPDLFSSARQGAVITAVQEGGPAQLSGIRPLDVVVQLGEQPIYSATQLLLDVSALPPETTVKLVLKRSPATGENSMPGRAVPLQEMMFKVRLGTRPNSALPASGIQRQDE